ncbi:MAG: amidohydrolase family protein [Gemmatimonas sp.]
MVPPRKALDVAVLDATTPVPIIDVHAHMRPGAGPRRGAGPGGAVSGGFDDAAQFAANEMKRYDVVASIILPPPNVEGRGAEANAYAQAVAPYEGLYVAAGGGSLNPMIERAHSTGEMGPQIAGPFRQLAERFSHSGIVALGEFASVHLSMFNGHPYEDTPPDHPLFMMLADIAAENDLPIDLHMEVIPQDMDMPKGWHQRSSANPETIKGNVDNLERLLAHNANARVVWAHVGWDNTGYWTVDLTRRLLAAHANLFLSIKLNPNAAAPENRPVAGNGSIKPEWLALFREFPDRFVIGTDAFYNAVPNAQRSPDEGTLDQARRFVDALPDDLKRKIAYANAVRIYRLDRSHGGA